MTASDEQIDLRPIPSAEQRATDVWRWRKEIRPEVLRERATSRHDPMESDLDFWTRYDRYLSSPEWQDRRQKVLARCEGVCEACRIQPATQVHHVSYKHVGNEPLFDLRGVCAECHTAMHGKTLPVHPEMMTARDWLDGAGTWYRAALDHLKRMGTRQVEDGLAERFMAAATAYKSARYLRVVEDEPTRVRLRSIWFGLFSTVTELTTGKAIRSEADVGSYSMPRYRTPGRDGHPERRKRDGQSVFAAQKSEAGQ